MEVPFHQIARMCANLTYVRAVGALPFVVDDRELLLAHQATDDLLGYGGRAFSIILDPQGVPHAFGSERFPAPLEDDADTPSDVGVLGRARSGVFSIVVRAVGNP